jgi:hypothetical protein
VLTLAYGKPMAKVLIAKRPQLVKLGERKIDYKELHWLLAKHFDNAEEVFGEEEEPPVEGPLKRSAHRTGAKEHRAKR